LIWRWPLLAPIRAGWRRLTRFAAKSANAGAVRAGYAGMREKCTIICHLTCCCFRKANSLRSNVISDILPVTEHGPWVPSVSWSYKDQSVPFCDTYQGWISVAEQFCIVLQNWIRINTSHS
jgi:hypothetical protein